MNFEHKSEISFSPKMKNYCKSLMKYWLSEAQLKPSNLKKKLQRLLEEEQNWRPHQFNFQNDSKGDNVTPGDRDEMVRRVGEASDALRWTQETKFGAIELFDAILQTTKIPKKFLSIFAVAVARIAAKIHEEKEQIPSGEILLQRLHCSKGTSNDLNKMEVTLLGKLHWRIPASPVLQIMHILYALFCLVEGPARSNRPQGFPSIAEIVEDLWVLMCDHRVRLIKPSLLCYCFLQYNIEAFNLEMQDENLQSLCDDLKIDMDSIDGVLSLIEDIFYESPYTPVVERNYLQQMVLSTNKSFFRKGNHSSSKYFVHHLECIEELNEDEYIEELSEDEYIEELIEDEYIEELSEEKKEEQTIYDVIKNIQPPNYSPVNRSSKRKVMEEMDISSAAKKQNKLDGNKESKFQKLEVNYNEECFDGFQHLYKTVHLNDKSLQENLSFELPQFPSSIPASDSDVHPSAKITDVVSERSQSSKDSEKHQKQNAPKKQKKKFKAKSALNCPLKKAFKMPCKIQLISSKNDVESEEYLEEYQVFEDGELYINDSKRKSIIDQREKLQPINNSNKGILIDQVNKPLTYAQALRLHLSPQPSTINRK